MQGIYGGSCCCDESPTLCDAWPICTEIPDECDESVKVIPGYVSIGYPLGPTLYDGPFWVAWHNSVVSRRNTFIETTIAITITKRTVVIDSCGGSCTVAPTPKVDITCTDSAIPAVAGCQITEYVDTFQWTFDGRLAFIGGSKDQNPCAFHDVGNDIYHPGVPKGPYPYVLTDCNRTGLTPNAAVPVTANNVNWWPAENRRVVPRFAGTNSVVKSEVPSTDYTQMARCNRSVSVLRCGTTAVESANLCIDAPITIVPGHTTTSVGDIAICGDGTHPCHLGEGGVPAACSDSQPNNGAQEAAWAIDIKEDDLIATLVAIGFPVDKAIGDVKDMWVAHTSHGRFRILYGMEDRLSPDDVWRFTDDVSIVESHVVGEASAGKSYTIKVELDFKPINWCRQNPRCGCVHSFCENAPSTINVNLYTSDITGCSSTVLDASYSLGLGEYTIPNGAFTAICGAQATPSCMQYPVSTPGNFPAAPCGPYYPPTSPGILIDFVGSHPVERAHAGWVRYRNKYDHYYCLNTIDTGLASACCPAPVAVGGQNYTHISAGCGTLIDPAWAILHQPCPGIEPGCSDHTIPNPGEIVDCRAVQYVSGAIGYSAALVPSFCHNCTSSWFECGQMIFQSCGTVLYDVCDCCNTQVTISQYELLIIDWDTTEYCTPIGQHDLYGATSGTSCETKNFIQIGYAEVG